MAPTLERPPFHRDGWAYDEKVDGWRMLAYKDGPRVRLISRNAVDHTARFRELARAIAKLRPNVLVLDGEVATFDEQLVSRFQASQRPGTSRPLAQGGIPATDPARESVGQHRVVSVAESLQ